MVKGTSVSHFDIKYCLNVNLENNPKYHELHHVFLRSSILISNDSINCLISNPRLYRL